MAKAGIPARAINYLILLVTAIIGLFFAISSITARAGVRDRMLTLDAKARLTRPLLKAIYTFKCDSGYYPHAIALLAPAYLRPQQVPDSADPGAWMYQVMAPLQQSRASATESFILSSQLPTFTGTPFFLEFNDDGTAAGWRTNKDGERKEFFVNGLNMQVMKTCGK